MIANAVWIGLPHQRLLAISQIVDLRHHRNSGVVDRLDKIQETHILQSISKIRVVKSFQKSQKKKLTTSRLRRKFGIYYR